LAQVICFFHLLCRGTGNSEFLRYSKKYIHGSCITTLSEINTLSETIISLRVDPSTLSEINISLSVDG